MARGRCWYRAASGIWTLPARARIRGANCGYGDGSSMEVPLSKAWASQRSRCGAEAVSGRSVWETGSRG